MKVLFIYPSAESQLGFNYGVAHMAAILKRAGHAVSFWQLCEEIEPLPTEEFRRSDPTNYQRLVRLEVDVEYKDGQKTRIDVIDTFKFNPDGTIAEMRAFFGARNTGAAQGD